MYAGIVCRLDFTDITRRSQQTSICRYSEDIQQSGRLVYQLLQLCDSHLFVNRSHTLSWLSCCCAFDIACYYSSMDGWIDGLLLLICAVNNISIVYLFYLALRAIYANI